MVKHNQPVQSYSQHRKNIHGLIKVWLDQAGKAKARRLARQVKAAARGCRPIDKLRPIVQCPGRMYNDRARFGRGFTLAELNAVGIKTFRAAASVGIAGDPRRKNRNMEGFQRNVDRLKDYMSRLVIFPKKGDKAKRGIDGLPDDTLRGTIDPQKRFVKNLRKEFPIRRTKSVLVD